MILLAKTKTYWLVDSTLLEWLLGNCPMEEWTRPKIKWKIYSAFFFRSRTVSFGLQALLHEPPPTAQPTVTHHLHRFPQCIRPTIAYHECHARGIPLRNNSTIDARTAGRLRRSLCHFIGCDFQRCRYYIIQGKFSRTEYTQMMAFALN